MFAKCEPYRVPSGGILRHFWKLAALGYSLNKLHASVARQSGKQIFLI